MKAGAEKRAPRLPTDVQHRLHPRLPDELLHHRGVIRNIRAVDEGAPRFAKT